MRRFSTIGQIHAMQAITGIMIKLMTNLAGFFLVVRRKIILTSTIIALIIGVWAIVVCGSLILKGFVITTIEVASIVRMIHSTTLIVEGRRRLSHKHLRVRVWCREWKNTRRSVESLKR